MRTVAILAAGAVISLSPAITSATSPCPSEVKGARTLLTAKTTNVAKATQASKSQAATRGQDVRAPRNVAKGRAAALTNARRLVNEAETACKDADAQRALANAHAAMELLKYVP